MSDRLFLVPIDDGSYGKNNPTDFESFKKFQNEIDEKYSKVELERVITERKLNLEQWDDSLPQRWRGASLSKMSHPVSKDVLKSVKSGGRAFFITGGPSGGKTFLSYAILRKFIGGGVTTLSQIKITSEDSFLGFGFMGFEGRAKLEQLFDSKYNTYFFDSVGEKDVYDQRREIPIWERIIDHIYSNSLNVIFTSNFSLKSFAKLLSESGQAKLESLIEGREFEINNGKTVSPSRERDSSPWDGFDG